VVVDANVVVAGLRSRRGVAFRLLSEVGKGRFEIALSVPLVLEYEDALLRPHVGNLGQAAVGPLLPDPKDDMLLELAVAARRQSIITYNVRDFVGAEKFGISVLEPGPFLSGVGVLK